MAGSRDRRAWRTALLALGLMATADVARADAKNECLSSFEEVQLKRRAGELRAAREAARACSGVACVDAVRNQCVAWFDEINGEIPTIILQARKDGDDVLDVKVSLDGKVVTTRLDGKPLEVDPGPHRARFEIAGAPPVERDVLVAAGDKNRSVAASFGAPSAGTARDASYARMPVEPPRERPVPAAVWVLGGVGVAALASFAAFGVAGASQRDDLQSTCEPLCSSDDVSKVRTKLVVADVSLGVGVVALGAAGYLFFTRPSRVREPSVGLVLPFDVKTRRDGAVMSWTGSF